MIEPTDRSKVPTISDLRDGDDSAWANLEASYGGRLRAYFTNRTAWSPLDVADDLAQETFVRMFEKRKTLDVSYSSVLPWMFQVAHRVFVTWCRKSARLKNNEGDSLPADVPDPSSEKREDAMMSYYIELALGKMSEECLEYLEWVMEPKLEDPESLMEYARQAGVLPVTMYKKAERCREKMRLEILKLLGLDSNLQPADCEQDDE